MEKCVAWFLVQRWMLKYFCNRILVWGVLAYDSSSKLKQYSGWVPLWRV